MEEARVGEPDISAAVLEALRSVYDPCCREQGISVVDMGLIDSVSFDGGEARLQLVLTSGWCPFAVELLNEVRDRVEALPDVADATVEILWEKGWSSDRLSPEATSKLRFLPDPVAVSDRAEFVAARLNGDEASEGRSPR